MTKQVLLSCFALMISGCWEVQSLQEEDTVGGAHGNRETEEKVRVFYAFRNTTDNQLGVPLPAGVFRVYG